MSSSGEGTEDRALEPVLEVSGLGGGYGALQVLWGIDLRIDEAETVVLLGANGAGKTTLLRTLVGLLPPRGGQVTFCGARIERLRTHERVRRGISFMSETGVFAGLTVEENLLLGAYYRPREAARARAEELLGIFPDLARFRRRPAGALSGGQRKMLGVAKAFMAGPRLLIMDEPSSGLSPRLVGEVLRMLSRLRAGGASLLIAEQSVRFLDIADRVYILGGGRVSFHGTVAEVTAHQAIREAYFGVRKS